MYARMFAMHGGNMCGISLRMEKYITTGTIRDDNRPHSTRLCELSSFAKLEIYGPYIPNITRLYGQYMDSLMGFRNQQT